MHRQLGNRPVALDCRQRHLRLESRTVLLPCPLHVLLPRYPRFLGAGLHLSHLSHFPGPAQASSPKLSALPPPSPSKPPAEPTTASRSTASEPFSTTSPPSPKHPW